MRADFSTTPAGRPSAQTRPIMPEQPGDLHPRLSDMVEAFRELRGRDGGVRDVDLRREGFSVEEIAEFRDQAVKIADGSWTRQVGYAGDLLRDMKMKAREAIGRFPILPPGTRDTAAITIAWNRYCKARAAFALDPWDSQRERCLKALGAYMALTTAGPAVSAEVIAEARTYLARVRQ